MNCKKFTGWIFLCVSTVSAIQSCKKNNDVQPSTDNTQNGKYYLTATVDGTAWKANLVAAGDSAGLMIVLGFKIINKDTSAFTIAFPDNTAINHTAAFNPAQNSVLIFATQPANSNFTAYETDPPNQGSGTFTVIQLDKTAKMVEGTFSAEAVNPNNSSDKIEITNGKFYIPYIIGYPDSKK